MIRKLLLSFLFFLLPFLKIRAKKFNFKIVFVAVLLGLSINTTYSQCNTASTGTVSSNTDKMCVGTNQTFSSNGWGGGTWTSSNSSVLQNVGNNEFKAIAAGTADVIYSITQNGCSEVKSSRKTITVYNALGTISEITGTSPQCEKVSNQVYSVSPVAHATNYVWTVPNGWSIDSGSGTNSITVTVGNPNQGGNITVYATNSCASTVTKSLYSNVNPTIKQTPNATGASSTQCTYAMLTWNNVNDATGFYLDIATDINFTNFVGIYNNYNVAYNNGSSPVYDLPPGTLYYRVRAYNSCTVTGYSSPRSFSTIAPVGGSASSPQTICSGATPANLTLANNTGTVLYWEKSTTSSFTSATQINNSASTTLLGSTIGPLTTSTYFRAVVTGSNCNSYSNSVLVTVGNSISAASSSPTVCVNASMTAITHATSGFTTIVSSTGLPTGVNAILNNNILTISGTPSATGNYSYNIQLNGSCGNANATGTIRVNPAPAITTQPTAPTATCSGTGTRTITIVATGTNLVYTWKKDGTTISNGGVYTGQGTATLTLTNPTTTNQGNYTVDISGDCSNSPITSNQVAVTINSAPAITTQPTAPAATCSGSGTQSMTVVASGTGPLTYQWKKDGTNITNGAVVGGATTATLTLTNPTTANQGNYTVQISGSCTPAVTSNAVAVTINTAPAITTQPATPPTTCSGSGTQSMTVVATGTGLTYQWRKGGTPITNSTVVNGATSPTLTLTNPTASDAGSYDVVVTGTCSPAVTSSAITVTVYTPTITEAPQAKTCANRRIAYNTQGGKSNYMWSVSGIPNTDYIIRDRGTSTDSYIIIEWLTIGSKTVSVNYTNANGCTTSTPGTYTTEIVILDKGQVNGGKHICPGETLPTLTFNTYANSSVRYPDTSVIAKWQYSDGNNTNYIDIPGTAGQTSYTPSSIPGSTRQYRVVVDNGVCTDQSIYSAIDIDVTTAITAQSTAGQSVCIGNAFTPISVTAVGTPRAGQSAIEYQWYSTTQNNNTTGSAITGATSNIYTPLSTTAGTLYYYCIVRGQCGTVTSTVSGAFITNAKPTAPSAIVTTQPTCSGTKGTITITPVSGLTYSINGTDYYNQSVFSSLDPATYIVTAKNASGCISPGTSLQVNTPTSKTWTGQSSKDWNVATNWSPSGIPTATDCVIIPSGLANSPTISNTSIEANAYTLTVNDEASLIVETGNTLRVNSAIKVLSSATTVGSLLFKNNSSLIQTNPDPNINSGPISYIRNSLPIRQADYVYWSTPVKGQTLEAVSSATGNDYYLAYNGSQWVGVSKTTEMIVGKGYIIRGPETYSNTNRQTFSATFTGTPNNGTLPGETVAASKYYLVGNPYPSALDANKFILDANNKDILKGTLYFWTHNTPVDLSGAYQYNTDDYASYNVSGGVKTAAASGTVSGNNNAKPEGQIAAGQSFFVGTKAAGTITFNNTMRSGADNNGQFFKPGKTSKEGSFERHRVWLNMTNAGGAFKQLLVGYIEGATNAVETGFDGATFDGNKYLDFYSINGNSKLVIQGRELPFTDSDIVPLGYKTTIAGEFTIAIDETDGDLQTQKIYLEDKTTSVIHDLTASNYTFTTVAGTFTDRFVLRYTNKSLGTGDFENIENGVLVSLKDKILKVLSSNENLKEVTIYDISGRVLYNKTKISSNELQVPNLQSSNQVLIVKVTLENGFTVSKKIVFQ